jgi:flagellar biosynthesis anti-sigma factor FlgM
MRIDLNPKSPEVQNEGSSVRDRAAKKADAPESGVQDQAQISSQAARVESLEKHINTVPEIRQAKVDALRAAVQSGRYKVSAGNIAESIFAAMIASA